MPLLLCPNCQTSMQEVHRNNVSLDMCPTCRGVWLDRGELETLLGQFKEVGKKYEEERKHIYQEREQVYKEHYKDQYKEHHKPYRKKGWMERAMDVFD